jgi:hypothetical protein
MGPNIFAIAMEALGLAQKLIAAAKTAGLTPEQIDELKARRDALNEEWGDLAPPD